MSQLETALGLLYMLVGSDAASELNPTGCGLHIETKNRNRNAQGESEQISVWFDSLP